MKQYILTAHTRYHLVVAILVQTVFRRVFLQLTVLHMALREAWTRAAEGRMSPSEQCKLWALREVLREQQQSDTQWEWMASRVQVVGGGNPASNGWIKLAKIGTLATLVGNGAARGR